MIIQCNKIKVLLDLNSKVYPWTIKNGIYVRGVAYYNNKAYYGESFAKLFDGISSFTRFKKMLESLDGFFSIIILTNDSLFVAVDHIRSLPLFYYMEKGIWIVTDALQLSDKKEFKISKSSVFQLDYSLGVIGNKTIYEDVYQLELGKCIEIRNNNILVETWSDMNYSKLPINKLNKAIQFVKSGIEKSFQYTYDALKGRTAVVPLSGGHDSRLIAYFLKQQDVNVVAYSYGKRDNEESRIAKKVAKELNIPFYFIEYNYRNMRRWEKANMDEYLSYAGNASSVPCIQEVYAVYYLKSHNLIPLDSVFIPGYSGDFLAGNHIPLISKEIKTFTNDYLLEHIIKKHFCENTKMEQGQRKILKSILNRTYNFCDTYTSFDSYSEAYEKYDLKERQTKFIVNAVRAYEFYGFEWLLPLFDRNQLYVWMKIAVELRENRLLFFNLEKHVYPEKICSIEYADLNNEISKNRIKILLSKYSIFPWTRIAHYCYSFSSIFDYFVNVYIKRNRSINHWVYCKYKKLFMKK